MEAIEERPRVITTYAYPHKLSHQLLGAGIYACGWCKGFIHEETVSNMQRYVHDEEPVTKHEVLPYRVDRS